MNTMPAVFNFNFRDFPIRIIDRDDEPWFVALDVFSALDISWKGAGDSGSLGALDDDEKGVSSIHTPGGIQEMSIISEPGMYKVVFRSNKPEAKRFTRWVAHEVLPAIRRHGFYSSQAYTVRPHGDFHPEALLTCDEQRQLLELRPDWKEIFDMYMRGLNGYEIADKLQKGRSTIYRKIVRMRRCGIIPKIARNSAIGIERALQEKFSDAQ